MESKKKKKKKSVSIEKAGRIELQEEGTG